MHATKIKTSFDAADVRPLVINDVSGVASNLAQLQDIGIYLSNANVHSMMTGMDAIQAPVTTASIASPVQFLQEWLPGFVRVATTPMNIDKILGIQTAGSFEDQEVVQGVIENTGVAGVYTDRSTIPFANSNPNWEKRSIVRFESGISVGMLAAARSAKVRIDEAAEQRNGATIALEKQRNEVGFYGYNGGNNATYGLLNDPSLGAYVTVATGAASATTWVSKTFDEIVKDLVTALSALRTQSQDLIDPQSVPITLLVATAAVEHLSRQNAIGSLTVRAWLRENYPNVTIMSDPHLSAANGGQNVFYLFANSVDNGSTDGGATFAQIVPAKFMVLGVFKDIKGYQEGYANATAGVMCKRPFAVVRYSGI